jgi:hypothetical protein
MYYNNMAATIYLYLGYTLMAVTNKLQYHDAYDYVYRLNIYIYIYSQILHEIFLYVDNYKYGNTGNI